MATEIGELSADGRYRWDGKSWQPVEQLASLPALVQQARSAAPSPVRFPVVQRVDLGAGAAFRLGFFAFFGAGCASLVFWVLAVIAIFALGGLGAVIGSLGSHT